MANPLHLEFLYAALNSPFGVVIQTTDPVRLKQQLYNARLSDADLSCLSFLTSPFNPSGELIILKGKEPAP